MVRKKLPTAKQVWDTVPKPALARKVLTMSKAGMYTFRVTQGRDLQGNPFYKVETRTIFGFLDQFCDLFTDNFSNRYDAFSFYQTCRNEAVKEYQRLKEKQERRIQDHGEK